eukprot:5610781-Pyramimonas_sp.AAC.1
MTPRGPPPPISPGPPQRRGPPASPQAGRNRIRPQRSRALALARYSPSRALRTPNEPKSHRSTYTHGGRSACEGALARKCQAHPRMPRLPCGARQKQNGLAARVAQKGPADPAAAEGNAPAIAGT